MENIMIYVFFSGVLISLIAYLYNYFEYCYYCSAKGTWRRRHVSSSVTGPTYSPLCKRCAEIYDLEEAIRKAKYKRLREKEAKRLDQKREQLQKKSI